MAELAPLVEQTVAESPGLAGLHGMLAVGHLDAGDEAQARALYERRSTEGFATEPDNYLWLSELVFWAEAAARLGDGPGCERLADCLAPWSGQLAFTGATCYGPVAQPLGSVQRVSGRLAGAERSLERAAAIAHAIDAPFFLARTELEQALLLGDRGDRSGAVSVARAARERAASHGCAALERRAATLLDSLV